MLINGLDMSVSKCFIGTGSLENFGLPTADDIPCLATRLHCFGLGDAGSP